jgi:hypothetical protein
MATCGLLEGRPRAPGRHAGRCVMWHAVKACVRVVLDLQFVAGCWLLVDFVDRRRNYYLAASLPGLQFILSCRFVVCGYLIRGG